MYLTEDSWGMLYRRLREKLLDAPGIIVRGELTRELSPAHFCLRNPTQNLFYHPKRHFHLPFATAESIMLFSRKKQARYLTIFNPRVIDYSDDGKTMYGSYGARVAPYWTAVIEKIRQDRQTRQAVLSIYQLRDLVTSTKDVPCTIALHFLVRDNRLDLHVYMRSNDFYWGLPYDLFSFTMAQQALANSLGLPVGRYFHSTSSLHVYERHFSWLQDIQEIEEGGMVNSADVTEMQTIALWLQTEVDRPKRSSRPMLSAENMLLKVLETDIKWQQTKDVFDDNLPRFLQEVTMWRWKR